MADGGYDPTDPTTDKDPLIPGTGDDDDNDDGDWVAPDWDTPLERKDPDRTQPFEPGAASTPDGGESIPMTERTRIPQERGPLIEETSFGGEPTGRIAWGKLKRSSRWLTKANLKRVTKQPPEQVRVVVAGGGSGPKRAG